MVATIRAAASSRLFLIILYRIAEYFSDSGKRVKIFAYRDSFIEQGGVEELMNDYGLNADDIAEYILRSV